MWVKVSRRLIMGGVPGDVVDEESSDGTSVVRPGDGSEILLSSCVPNLHFDGVVADSHNFRPEFNPDSGVMMGFKLVIEELQDDGRLPDS